MPKDFSSLGFALIAIGAVWLAFTVQADLSPLAGLHLFALSIIAAGIATIIFGVFRQLLPLKRFVSIAFAVWLILLIRANWLGFVTLPQQSGGNLDYENSFTVTGATAVTLSCDACSAYVGTSDTEDLRVVFDYSAPSSPEVQESAGVLNVGLKRTPSFVLPIDLAEFYINYDARDVSISAGAGSINLETERETVENSTLRVSTGVGSIDIKDMDALGFENLYISTGAGSADINITSLTGQKYLKISTGVGSAEITLPSSLAHRITYSTGLGSFDHPGRSCSLICSGEYETSGYSSAADRINIEISAGVGSISIKFV